MANPCIISGHSRSPASVVVRAVSSLSSNHRRRFPAALSLRLIRGEIPAMEKLGIIVERNPPESKLLELGVKQWPKYRRSMLDRRVRKCLQCCKSYPCVPF
ncbi:uncharacterized protein LOC110032613 [Phalaenopsis equestris]|uniref:uncharacterized protein LOC110032613 n=1 Tax=Phalaenopsis equestris TaxID=78828 RepID=UPI0009E63105|nr:uncharacterized protein LOC110032613 [Phalaenopsis equestris]